MSTHVSKKASSRDIVVNLLSGQLAYRFSLPDWQLERRLSPLLGLELLTECVDHRLYGSRDRLRQVFYVDGLHDQPPYVTEKRWLIRGKRNTELLLPSKPVQEIGVAH